MSKFCAVRSEEDVGILQRVGSHPRFEGVFKGRFSDFHVNEIDVNGKIVQLTTLEAPPERKSEILEDDPEICGWIPEDVRESVIDLQKRLETGKDERLHRTDPLWKEKIEIKVTDLNKEERTKIHKWLVNFDQLTSQTVDKDGEKFIVALFEKKNNRSNRRPACRGKYTHCVMYKEGVDTSEAIGQISKRLRIKPNLITFCGTKDKHGKTTQRICVSNIDANRLVAISKDTRSVKLGNYEYFSHNLRLGDLKGNHFKILLKDVKAESNELINAAVESLQTRGFINYFGLQRFGSYEISTHTVGKSVLQMNWMEAFDLILKQKPNDSDFMKAAKEEWFTNRDPTAAIKKFPHWHRSIESNLLHGLAKYFSKNDYMGAFIRIPRNCRNLYIHAFQSFLWNKVASFRIKEMGLQPVVGDLVYTDKEQADFFVEGDNENDDEEEGAEIESGNHRLNSITRQSVKVLTAEDLPQYTIYDVLIPMQGTEIRIPDNRTKEFYDELLKHEGLDADCFLKFKISSDRPKGAYRKLVVCPQNVSSKVIPYCDSDPVDTFIPSEIDKLNEQKLTVKAENNDNSLHEISNEKEDSRMDISGNDVKLKEEATIKDKKCVIVEFSLPSSSYATMALREIMLSDSERSEHVDSSREDQTKRIISDDPDNAPEAKRRREDND